LCQNIIPLTQDEIDRIHKERIQKIKQLGLRGITSQTVDTYVTESEEEIMLEKKEMMDNVIEELEDFGEID
jgi:Icc-related predicted phosphoesterase